MCSVVGYVGKGQCRAYVMEGLTRLEYRGYDSAGFACLRSHDNQLMYAKSQGGISNLLKNFEQSPIDGHIGMGHTRWSTHGVASTENAHPHFDCHKTLSIVHNGIIENYHDLKEKLLATGHVFVSQTDTETIAHLFEALLHTHKTFKAAVLDLVHQLQGAYAFSCLLQAHPDTMLIVRKRSPLCIGIGDGEMFIASDALAFAGRTNKVVYLPDESFAFIKKGSIELYSFCGKELPLDIQIVDITWSNDGKQGYEHFMLKEIYEQKKVINDTLYKCRALGTSLWKQLGITSSYAKDLASINFIGCGTSWHAARIAEFFFESITQIPARAHLASEFRYLPFFPEKKSIHIAISQSGETADTLESIRFVNTFKTPTAALTNVASSTMVREAHGFMLTYAGPEVAVASTKAFSAQVAALYWLAHRIALEKGRITTQRMELAESELLIVAEILENSIETYKRVIIQKLAPYYAQFKQAIFLGRHISFPFAQEAALKLKEISYIFTDCYPAGELKHGPLALIDAHTPVFLFSSADPLIYQKLLANAQEVKARSGHLVVFAFEGQKELLSLADCAFVLPQVNPLLAPLAMTGLMQFFVYQIAQVLNRPIDKPRNLAKSVTVE
ncbi:glutamine--fructose-6-phosphate transaminase (isomerizing) [Candidatus Dependentiae bacterium]|nr:glutamine--fructose-6-phosphate transaminase (isomerizing) [Candidatus Dependentiae bacterium]